MTLLTPVASGTAPAQGPLVDRFGRDHTYLRVSVTDRCSLRCTYCMPAEGVAWMNRSHLLTYEEVARVVAVFARLGVRRVRLTGGEPLIRRDIVQLVRQVASIGLDDLAMTTNGLRLVELAPSLASAGLRRVNVSCDALDPALFRRMTRGGDVAAVLQGIEAARSAGLTPIKVNAVMIDGTNLDEAERLVEHFAPHAADTVVRFIEHMPFGTSLRDHIPARAVHERLAARWTLTPLGRGLTGPAVRWRVEETGQEVGFISPMTEHFCEACNRLRLEADGHLRTCLSRDDTPSLRDLLRGGASEQALDAAIRGMVWQKVAGHEAHLEGGAAFEGVMTQIGG